MGGWYREASVLAAHLLSAGVFVRGPLVKFECSVPLVLGWEDCTSRLCRLGEEEWKQEHGAVFAALLPHPVEDATYTHISCPCWL